MVLESQGWQNVQAKINLLFLTGNPADPSSGSPLEHSLDRCLTGHCEMAADLHSGV